MILKLALACPIWSRNETEVSKVEDKASVMADEDQCRSAAIRLGDEVDKRWLSSFKADVGSSATISLRAPRRRVQQRHAAAARRLDL